MKLHLAVVSVLALASAGFAPPAESLRFAVAESTRVRKTFEHEIELELERFTMRFDGEEIDTSDFGINSLRVDAVETLVFVDRYGASANGRPLRLERKFESLSGEEKQTVELDEGDEADERTESSPLEGMSVVFAWNEEDGAHDPSFEGDGGDEELLAGLVEDTDLRVFLPEGEVEPEHSWSIAGKAFNALLYPSGDLALSSEDDDEEAAKSQGQLRDNLTGELRATFTGVREEGEQRLAVIEVRGEVSTHAETSSEENGESRYEVEQVVSGEILWLVGAGRPHSAKFECELKFRNVVRMQIDAHGEAHSSEREMLFKGRSEHTTTFEVLE